MRTYVSVLGVHMVGLAAWWADLDSVLAWRAMQSPGLERWWCGLAAAREFRRPRHDEPSETDAPRRSFLNKVVAKAFHCLIY